MDDEIPAPLTPNGPIDGPGTTNGPAPSRSARDESDRGEPVPTEPDRDDDRLRDGVDPPAEAGRDRPETDPSETDEDRDDACDSEPTEYRLERLRLLRTVVTLAVVVARLIRSL